MVKKGLPDRWLDYTSMGRRIDGTRFICFKVPLDDKFSAHGGDFSCRELTDNCSSLGLVIDLTNTTRYYNPKALENAHVEYKKIFTEGHVLPSKKVVKQFHSTVNDFLDRNDNNDKLIGVHCTHGVNRTGYLVCRYMIQILGVAPDQAISDFDSARGHNQERKLYTDDLRNAEWIDENPADYGSRLESKKKRNDSRDNLYHDGFEPNRSPLSKEETPTSYGNRRRSYGRRSGGSWRKTPDAACNWTVSPADAATSWRRPTRNEETEEAVTPKGSKRRRDIWDDEDESPAKRGPWFPTDNLSDSFDDRRKSPRPSFKRKNMGSQFDEGLSNKYDPYYYQQRNGGGPRRVERKLSSQSDRPNTRYGSSSRDNVRQYRGPKSHKDGKKVQLDDSIATQSEDRLGLENHEPLSMPEDVDKKTLFDSFELFGPSKDVKSPEPDLLSPENKSGVPSKKRRSQRYIPY